MTQDIGGFVVFTVAVAVISLSTYFWSMAQYPGAALIVTNALALSILHELVR